MNMKKISFLLYVVATLCTATFISCETEDVVDPNKPMTSKTISATEITEHTVLLTGEVRNTADMVEVGFLYGTDSTKVVNNQAEKVTTMAIKDFSINVNTLRSGVKYYYKAFAVVSKKDNITTIVGGDVKSFMTKFDEGNFKAKAQLLKSDYNNMQISIIVKHDNAMALKIGAFVSVTGIPSPENHIDDMSIPLDASKGGNYYDVAFSLNNLAVAYTYQIRPYIYDIAKHEYTYGDVVAMTSKDVTAGDAIDMGLSKKWARCNIGATSPGEVGSLFAFGETEPRTEFTLQNYLFNDGLLINRNISGTGYDAAYVILGKQWSIPTDEEMQELKKYSDIIRNARYKETKGDLVISKKNHNAIFLPYAQVTPNIEGCFWTGIGKAYTYDIDLQIYHGIPVRGVTK